MMLQSTTADTALRNWYDSTTVANIGLFKNVADSIDANPQQAKEVNEGINPDNHAEENEKAVNAVYIETWAVDSFEFTPEQYDILYAIANENPLTGGTGVYAARVMLGLDIDDDESGSRLMQQVQENTSSSLVDNNIRLMPNPAKDRAVNSNKLEKNQRGTVNVYSKFGAKIQSYLLHESYNRVEINLQRLAQGIYFIKTEVDGEITDVKKLVVIK